MPAMLAADPRKRKLLDKTLSRSVEPALQVQFEHFVLCFVLTRFGIFPIVSLFIVILLRVLFGYRQKKHGNSGTPLRRTQTYPGRLYHVNFLAQWHHCFSHLLSSFRHWDHLCSLLWPAFDKYVFSQYPPRHQHDASLNPRAYGRFTAAKKFYNLSQIDHLTTTRTICNRSLVPLL